jgi:hypothetical protein
MGLDPDSEAPAGMGVAIGDEVTVGLAPERPATH